MESEPLYVVGAIINSVDMLLVSQTTFPTHFKSVCLSVMSANEQGVQAVAAHGQYNDLKV